MNQNFPDPPPLHPGDFYLEGENIVFTAQYLLKRGYCCGSGCRHCPYCDAGAPADPAAGDPPAGA